MPEVPADRDFVKAKTRRVVGVDVFVESPLCPEQLGKSVEKLVAGSPFTLKAISSRGTKVYPPTGTVLDVTDMYTCRLMAADATADLTDDQMADVVKRVAGVARWATSKSCTSSTASRAGRRPRARIDDVEIAAARSVRHQRFPKRCAPGDVAQAERCQPRGCITAEPVDLRSARSCRGRSPASTFRT